MAVEAAKSAAGHPRVSRAPAHPPAPGSVSQTGASVVRGSHSVATPSPRQGVRAGSGDWAVAGLAVLAPGPREQSSEVVLGAFVRLANNRFDPARHSTSAPRFWAGRVEEIKRSGVVRLHWFKEVRLGSCVYTGTNTCVWRDSRGNVWADIFCTTLVPAAS